MPAPAQHPTPYHGLDRRVAHCAACDRPHPVRSDGRFVVHRLVHRRPGRCPGSLQPSGKPDIRRPDLTDRRVLIQRVAEDRRR
jgi:hypothetical protein